jgi:probable F420-dependent oxidoreductase
MTTMDALPEGFTIADQARRAEAAGASSLWANDHLMLIDDPQSHYPYSPDGQPHWESDAPQYEALISLAVAGAVTTTPRLGTAVVILPQRNVIELAKATASLDRLVGGRLLLGVGIGWQREEMEALGYDFGSRVTRTEEMIEALRMLWRGRPDPYRGTQVTIPAGIVMEPRPDQPGGIPIIMGGLVQKARDRAARLGDGWIAVDDVARVDAGRYAEQIAEMRSQRDGAPFPAFLSLEAHGASVDELRRVLSQLDEAGFDEVALELGWTDPEAAESLLATLSAEYNPPRGAPSA